jgi:drug/metabolite transporter (DMT)-like permease
MVELLGLVVACSAAALYAVGIALQAYEARSVPVRHSLRPSMLRELASQRRWLLGALLGLVAWFVQAGALFFTPLTIVQPALAVGLIVLMVVGATRLGEHVGRQEVIGVTAIVVGISGLAYATPPHSSSHAGGARLILVLTALGAAAAAPYIFPGLARRSAGLLAVGAGLSYAFVGLATKFATDDFTNGRLLGLLFWLALTLLGVGFGMVTEMSAFQRRPATRVVPVVLTAQAVVPVLLAPILASEHWSSDPLARLGLAGSLALVVVGAMRLGRSTTVAVVVRPETAIPASGSAVGTRRQMQPFHSGGDPSEDVLSA